MATQPANHRSSEAELASFVSALSSDDCPTEEIRLAERCFVDTVGVTLAGAADDAGTTVAASVGRTSASDGVRLIGHGERASDGRSPR